MDTPTSSPKPTAPNCVGGNCADCIKGGMPLRKETVSFLMILFMITTTILLVLFVNAKREGKSFGDRDDQPAMVATKETPAPSVYPIPAASAFTKVVALPKPVTTGKMSVETALQTRRTIRAYTNDPVTLAQLSQMLWSGQGQTDPSGKRTAPSARESYSMTLFAVVQNVTGLEDGVYEYVPKTHSLGQIKTGDVGEMLKNSSAEAGAVPAPVVFVLTSSFGTYQAKTKSANFNSTYMEAGHIGQNMYLQAQSLGMGMVVMGGFDTKKITSAFGIDPAQTVEYVIPFGKPAPAVVVEK